MRIPGTSFRTTWRTDWLLEFSTALILLGFLFREELFTIVGITILTILAALGFSFSQRLAILRKTFRVEQSLAKNRVSLLHSIEGELRISNKSKFPAQIMSVEGILEEPLRLELQPSFGHMFRSGVTLNSKFAIKPLARGRFRILGWKLGLRDPRQLFIGEVTSAQESLIEVYPTIETKAPLSPLTIYGERADIFRRSHTGTDYAGTLEYAPGDEYQKVEWKATARLRRLMIKQFHLETEAVLHILIDAGNSMHTKSYVGTRIDDALAVAQLVLQSISESGNQVGIWIYDETEVVKALKPQSAIEQLPMLRNLAVTLKTKSQATQTVAHIQPRRFLFRASSVLENPRLSKFVEALRFGLRLGHSKRGVYKAISKAMWAQSDNWLIVLTDLETNTHALFEAVSSRRERVSTVVGQIGAAWRFSERLEDAYVAFRRNRQLIQHLEESGLTVLDVWPEKLVESITTTISGALAIPIKRA